MKTVLITGASHGIGKAIAKAFAQSGYALYLNCRRSGDECTAYAKELSKEYHVPCKAAKSALQSLLWYPCASPPVDLSLI